MVVIARSILYLFRILIIFNILKIIKNGNRMPDPVEINCSLRVSSSL
jgi:hypothetical protein